MAFQHDAFDDRVGRIAAQAGKFHEIVEGQQGRKVEAAWIELRYESFQTTAPLRKGRARRSCPVCRFPSCRRS